MSLEHSDTLNPLHTSSLSALRIIAIGQNQQKDQDSIYETAFRLLARRRGNITVDPRRPRPDTHRFSSVYCIKAGKYFFTKDLTIGSSNVGITVLNVSDVTIDLKGFYLRPPGPYSDQNGIVASNADNLVIQNGNFGRFELGAVSLDHCRACSLQNLNVTDFRYIGIDVNECTDSIITNCQVARATAVQTNDETGIYLTGGSGNLVVKDAFDPSNN